MTEGGWREMLFSAQAPGRDEEELRQRRIDFIREEEEKAEEHEQRLKEEKYSSPLVKASMDPFTYALGMRNGTVVRFAEAKIYGEWVHLQDIDRMEQPLSEEQQLPYPCPRGVSVRLSEIVWVADAPEGS